MAEEFNSINIGNLNDGRALEAIEDGLQKIVNNILDVNTDPEQTRKLKVMITVKPNFSRTYAEIKCEVQPVLAAVPASVGEMHINPTTRTGYIRDFRQDELFAEKVEPINKDKPKM